MTIQTNIDLRKGGAAAWRSVNPILEAGEPGFETDTKKLKFGDGTTEWNSLPYFRVDGGELVDGNNADFAFDPNYVGGFIELTNNWTASFTDDSEVRETSALTNFAIKSGDKVVFSMTTVYGGYPEYTGVGIANRQFNVNNYLGKDYNSIGFWDNGSVYNANHKTQTLNLTFDQNGNVVDVAVDRVNNLIWARVDGGDWNGDNTQNPTTATGGIDISGITGYVYPGACPYAYSGVFGNISINSSVSNPPAGFNILVRP